MTQKSATRQEIVDISDRGQQIVANTKGNLVLANEEAAINTRKVLAHEIVAAKMYPEIKHPGMALAIMWWGYRNGIDEITSLQNVFPVYGRFTFSAYLIQSMMERAGVHIEVLESTINNCKLRFSHREKAHDLTWEFTIEDAKRAQLVKPNSNWEKWPRDMCYCRCLTQGGRKFYPRAIQGMYLREELEADYEIVDDDRVHRVKFPDGSSTDDDAPDMQPGDPTRNTGHETATKPDVDEQTGEVKEPDTSGDGEQAETGEKPTEQQESADKKPDDGDQSGMSGEEFQAIQKEIMDLERSKELPVNPDSKDGKRFRPPQLRLQFLRDEDGDEVVDLSKAMPMLAEYRELLAGLPDKK